MIIQAQHCSDGIDSMFTERPSDTVNGIPILQYLHCQFAGQLALTIGIQSGIAIAVWLPRPCTGAVEDVTVGDKEQLHSTSFASIVQTRRFLPLGHIAATEFCCFPYCYDFELKWSIS